VEESSEPQDRQLVTPVPDGQQYYLDIVDLIDRLYKLSMVIRNPQLRNRSTKAEAFIERDDEGRDVSKDFELYAITRALHQMCTWKNVENPDHLTEADKRLATGLGKANSRRRRQFIYDQKHHRKLSKLALSVDAEQERTNLAPIAPIDFTGHPVRDQVFNDTPQMLLEQHGSFPGHKAPTLLSATTATAYIAPRKPLSDSGSTFSASTAYSGYQMSDISIPAAPEDKFNKDFECPYCEYPIILSVSL
jgi:hypothetical protein